LIDVGNYTRKWPVVTTGVRQKMILEKEAGRGANHPENLG
jgi:hypothetical protein